MKLRCPVSFLGTAAIVLKYTNTQDTAAVLTYQLLLWSYLGKLFWQVASFYRTSMSGVVVRAFQSWRC